MKQKPRSHLKNKNYKHGRYNQKRVSLRSLISKYTISEKVKLYLLISNLFILILYLFTQQINLFPQYLTWWIYIISGILAFIFIVCFYQFIKKSKYIFFLDNDSKNSIEAIAKVDWLQTILSLIKQKYLLFILAYVFFFVVIHSLNAFVSVSFKPKVYKSIYGTSKLRGVHRHKHSNSYLTFSVRFPTGNHTVSRAYPQDEIYCSFYKSSLGLHYYVYEIP